MASFAAAPQLQATASTPATEFSAGLTAVMRRWSGLRSAVSGQWGGPESAAKADFLRQHLIDIFYPTGRGRRRKQVDAYDIEDCLVDYMEEEFCTVLEDNSPTEVSAIILEMVAKCDANDFSLARQMVHFAEVEAANPLLNGPPTVQVQGELSDDDEGDDADEHAMDEGGGGSSSSRAGGGGAPSSSSSASAHPFGGGALSYASGTLFVDPEAAARASGRQEPVRQLGEPAPMRPAPVVDEEGFQTNVRRSGRKNKGQLSNSMDTTMGGV